MIKYARFIENNFYLFVLIVSGLALAFPVGFVWIKPYIPVLLGIIMFGMGITLHFSDFAKVWEYKGAVFLGSLLQYTIMPVLAFSLSKILNLPLELMIGMIVLGACPGGTASNVICYLARANVALSVTLTLISTVLAPILTPAIIYLVLAQKVDISFWEMVKSVFWIVVFPLFDGLIIRHFFYKKMKNILDFFPSLSIICITIVIGAVVALNRSQILDFSLVVMLAVILHNLGGLTIGYFVPKILKYPESVCRTLSIEVGMQNSGLGAALTTKFFSSLSALVCAIFSVWHNISGTALAKYWSKDKNS
ncbi:bile acid:sodium symporter family protein [Candidatus Margulisiibacteriota bacterium]